MKNPFKRAGQSSRSYPAAGVSITGPADRFRRAKTSGARRAARDGQAWEDRDRQQSGTWYRYRPSR
ncbi:hypothetical protein ACFVY4_27115 [Streptomyces sp. NPDC058299]|uniref:hypothetical protein n=1 Tax=Streptomyces sp. NPDC058299 TaxID=3346435 RepID=UPI0036EC9953